MSSLEELLLDDNRIQKISSGICELMSLTSLQVLLNCPFSAQHNPESPLNRAETDFCCFRCVCPCVCPCVCVCVCVYVYVYVYLFAARQ
jgi:hypothetical protein